MHPYRVRTYRVLINAIWSWLTLRYFCAGSLQAFVLQRATMHTLCLMSLAQLSSATTSALPTPQFLNLLTSDCQCKISEDLLLKNNTSKGYSLVIGQLYIFFLYINTSKLEDFTLFKIISLLFLLLNEWNGQQLTWQAPA